MDEEELFLFYNIRNNAERHFFTRENYDQLSEGQFMKMFRLSKHLAQELIQMLTPLLPPPSRASDLSVESKVLAALHFYGTGSYQTPVGRNLFVAMSQSSISRSLEEVTNALIHENIINTWIRFPQNINELRNLRTRFYERYHIPGIIGCIDCTHIAIVPPQGDPEHPEHIYINRKNYHSLNVQLVCDDSLKIFNINARFPGSTHDAFIWRQSIISRTMERIYRENPQDPYFLIGDSGYPLRPWLMTPLRDPQPGPEERFNNAFKTARSIIERCNGVLKGRFRCLLQDRTLHYHPVKASKIVKACAVLHNMCIARGVPEIDNEMDVLLEGVLNAPAVRENGINVDLQRARAMQRQIINTHFV